MSDVDFEFLKKMHERTHERLDTMAGRLEDMELQISGVRNELREGLANLRSHDHAHHGDMQNAERRIADLELAVERLNHAQGINPED